MRCKTVSELALRAKALVCRRVATIPGLVCKAPAAFSESCSPRRSNDDGEARSASPSPAPGSLRVNEHNRALERQERPVPTHRHLWLGPVEQASGVLGGQVDAAVALRNTEAVVPVGAVNGVSVGRLTRVSI
jgi:hypothetical protein